MNIRLQLLNFNPTTSSQTITADSGYDGLDSVQINAVPTGIVTCPDINESGAYIDAVASTLTLSKSVALTPDIIQAGYISSGTQRRASVTLGSDIPKKTSNDIIVTGSTVKAPAGYYRNDAYGYVTDMALPTSTSSSSVGTLKATIEVDQNNRYLNIPVGYNDSLSYYKIDGVPFGVTGTPRATKGTVSNNSIDVTPSVTNTTGYITGGTLTGSTVTVSASELVSGSETKTANGTYDVTNLAELVVNVSGGSSYSQIGSDRYTVSTTSTSAGSVATLTMDNARQAFLDPTKTIYVRIRDINGARAGYFFGSDCYIIYNGTSWSFSKNIFRYTTDSAFAVFQATGTGGYGVYVYAVSTGSTSAGVRIYRRYSSTYSLTINSDYQVDVYVLSGPNNKGPFVV